MVRIIKPAVSTFFIFSLLPIVLLIILIVTSFKDGQMSFPLLSSFLLVSSIIYLWLFRTKIELTENDMVISGMFNSSIIPIQSINEVNIHIIPSNKSKYEMIIFHSSVAKKNPVKVNIKLFAKNDLQFLTNYLMQKNNNAKYDDRFINMKNGKMPSIFN